MAFCDSVFGAQRQCKCGSATIKIGVSDNKKRLCNNRILTVETRKIASSGRFPTNSPTPSDVPNRKRRSHPHAPPLHREPIERSRTIAPTHSQRPQPTAHRHSIHAGKDLNVGVGNRTGDTGLKYSIPDDNVRRKFTGYEKDPGNPTKLRRGEERMKKGCLFGQPF